MNHALRDLAARISGDPIAPDRGGYTLTMREDDRAPEVLEELRGLPRQGPRLHVGWGSFRNLDIVAARRSTDVLICDLNAHQLAVWRAVETALDASDAPAAFVERLADLLPTRPPLRQFAACTRAWLRGDLGRRESWLFENAPERFDHVRAVGFGLACVDIREPFAADFGALPPVDTLYLSNLPYMLKSPRGFFGEPHGEGEPLRRMWTNLGRIARDDTWVVRAERLAPASAADDLRWRTELARFADARRDSLEGA